MLAIYKKSQCLSDSTMLFIRNGHAAVLVLALAQCSAYASTENAKNETKDSAELIERYLKLPWMDGIDWLVHSSESPEAKEVKTFIRAVVAGETWATQILDTLWEDFANTKEGRVQYIRQYYGKIAGGCNMENADNDNDGGYCVASGIHAGSEHVQLSISSASEESKDFSVAEISTIVVFTVLGMVLLVCTICDSMERNSSEKSSTTVETLAKFSLYRNALAVLKTKSDADEIPAIHGLRCLCFCTVIYCHRCVMFFLLFKEQFLLMDLVKIRNTLFGISIEMSMYAVDTFCVIGGFLQAYTFFKNKRSGFKHNVFTMYLRRYVRLTPCIAVLILITVVFSDRFGSDPRWHAMTTEAVDSCREDWWMNLLYLQNLVTSDGICMAHTWYLGLDMQLFWLSPLILYPLYHSPKFGLRVLILSFVVAVFTPTIVLATKGYTNSLLRLDMDLSKIASNLSTYCMATYNRACPYLVGILLGYDVATRKRRLTKTNVTINWMVTGSLILFCIWLNSHVSNSGYVGDWHMEIPATLVLRPSWSIAIAWIVYACTQGYGGFVTKFLSLPIFFPLSRLSYCIYLVHPGIQWTTISSFTESMNPSLISHAANGVFGDVVLSTVVAFVFCLFIERPPIILTKILLNERGREPTVVTPVKESNNQSELAVKKDSISKTY